MDEYIKREPLLQAAKQVQGNLFDAPLIVDLIQNAPAEDVQAVRHGRWMGLHDGWYYSYSCSECGAEALTKEETMHDQVCSNFCPNCGAEMHKRDDKKADVLIIDELHEDGRKG